MQSVNIEIIPSSQIGFTLIIKCIQNDFTFEWSLGYEYDTVAFCEDLLSAIENNKLFKKVFKYSFIKYEDNLLKLGTYSDKECYQESKLNLSKEMGISLIKQILEKQVNLKD